jgi:hypothetical protein
MRRRTFLGLLGGTAMALPHRAYAQPAGRKPLRIGFVHPVHQS